MVEMKCNGGRVLSKGEGKEGVNEGRNMGRFDQLKGKYIVIKIILAYRVKHNQVVLIQLFMGEKNL